MTYNRADVATRAGVEPAYLDRLLELGILAPAGDGEFSSGDLRRLALIKSLERAGLPIDGIATAVRDGQLSLAFMDASSYDRFSTLSDISFTQLSARTGVPVELLMVIREAVGFAEPSPDDKVRDIEQRIAPLVQMQIAEGFRPAVIERWLRVYGESMRRIAETEADWWSTEVEQRLMASGMSAGEMVEEAGRAGLPPAHVGLHAGPVLFQEGDYFGQTVNVASRIADYARPGEVLVSQAVVDASADARASFTSIGPVELKGVSGPVHLHAARRPNAP